MKRYLLHIITFVTAVITFSCSGARGGDGSSSVEGDTLTCRSELLTLIDCGQYVAAIIADPWHPGNTLAKYALVPRGSESVVDLPDGFTVITTPLQRSVVESSTNSAAIAELGALEGIAAVSDGNYYNPSDTVAKLIAAGHITDIGNSMSPKIETLVDVAPDAILSSPYKNAGHGVIETLNVPIIECADYMETTPLGRAEWILLLGHLYACPEAADSIYYSVVTSYDSLRTLAASDTGAKPMVLTDVLSSGVWYVPGGSSYMAAMLSDAGALYPWSDDNSTGSLQLDVAAVIDKASDADIWIMRNYGTPTLASLRETSPLYGQIKAFNDAEVYNCDTSATSFFNDIAFHPERILADFIALFHPSLNVGSPVYFSKVQAR